MALDTNKCSFIKPDGNLCQAKPVKDSSLCFRHNPSLREANLQASRRGGQNRALQGQYGQRVKLDTASDVKEFLSEVINRVWIGEVPVPVGTSMGFLVRCWLDAFEKSDLERRIDLLEKNVKC